MNIQDYNILMAIFNNLNEISTRGQDTIIMGKCLEALGGLLRDKQTELINNNVTHEEE